MKKKKTLWFLVFLFYIVTAAAAGPVSRASLPAAPDEKTGAKSGKKFTFAPPVPVTCLLTVTTTTRRQYDENTPVIDVVKKEWKITFSKKEDLIHQTWEPLSVMTSRDGRVFDHPVHTVLMEFPFTLTLDPEGEVVSVEGLAGVQARMEGRVPETAWQSLAPLLSEDMLASGEAYDWKLLYADCLGKRAETGESWQSVESLGLAKRAGRPYFRWVKVQQPIHYAGRGKLKVSEFRNTDFEALKKAARSDIPAFSREETDRVMTWKDPEYGGIMILGEGFRIMDPETLLLYYVYLKQTEHTLFVSPEGRTSILKLREEREFHFTYPEKR